MRGLSDDISPISQNLSPLRGYKEIFIGKYQKSLNILSF